MRFLLIDRITHWEPGVRARAVKCVALSEDFFDDHFPLNPIVPGVLLIEGMAQLSGILLEEGVRRESGGNVKALLSIVERAKFRAPVKPGDTVEYEANVLLSSEAGGKVTARATVAGQVVADCGLVFSYHRIENEYLERRRAQVLEVWLSGLEERHDQ